MAGAAKNLPAAARPGGLRGAPALGRRRAAQPQRADRVPARARAARGGAGAAGRRSGQGGRGIGLGRPPTLPPSRASTGRERTADLERDLGQAPNPDRHGPRPGSSTPITSGCSVSPGASLRTVRSQGPGAGGLPAGGPPAGFGARGGSARRGLARADPGQSLPGPLPAGLGEKPGPRLSLTAGKKP